MTNTQFNKLWDKLFKYGHVKFTDCGETSELYFFQNDVSLKSDDGNVIFCGCGKEQFRKILVD